MKRGTLVLATLALVLCGVGQSRADVILYSNGPINGTYDGYYVDGFYTYNNGAATDAFTVARASTLTSATVGLWVSGLSGSGQPQSIDFSVGTSPFGTNLNNGSASLLSSTLLNSNRYWSVYSTTLDGLYTPGLQPGTTYWLTLYNAVPSWTGWDVNFGPSQAQWVNGIGTNTGPSNSFTLYGTPTVNPEPSSLVLAVTASITGLGYFGWSRSVNRFGLRQMSA